MADTERRRGSSSSAHDILLACLGAAVVTSGIQAIAPAIPAIQVEFSLSTAQVGLITSVYLFPSMFSALAAGVIADRIGARPVFAGSLLIFGLCGLVLLFVSSLWLLLVVRFVQGAAFGAVLSLSVAIIGGIVPRGPEAARAQGHRIIIMASAEAVFPVAGGLLLNLGWFAPFLIQVLAVPLAILVWLVLPPVQARRRLGGKASTRALREAPAVVGVQLLAGLRFVFKIGIWTYYPVLAVTGLGMSPALVGLAMGASSLLAALAAWRTEKLSHHWSSPQLISGCLLAIGISFAAMALATEPILMVAALLVFGVQDGVFGVAHNVLVTELAPAEIRSTYIGVTGTVRNVGKFAAPMIFGAAAIVLSLPHTFLLLAGLGIITVNISRGVGRTHTRLRRQEDGED